LLILKRDVKSYLPNPVNLKYFPGINQDHVEKMAVMGIKNTKHLFNKVQNIEELSKLSIEADIPQSELLEILKLSDLARINGVGPVFARMILDTRIDTAAKMANANAELLFKKLKKLNEEKNYTKAKFTQKDVQYCIDFAKKLPKGFEY
jgi:nucleotidyltransferase/DNA polymerase involved in DNA repair